MSFVRREIYTKDKEIQRYLDKLITDLSVEVPPHISFELSRYKTIQKLRNIDRKNPPILIGRDDRASMSIIMIRKPLTLKKDGNRYYFDL
jgi:hypothetical protein